MILGFYNTCEWENALHYYSIKDLELQKLEMQVHCEAESNLTVNGEFESKFLLTKKPIPVYAKAGVGVYAELFIYIDGNGEISVTLGNELHTKVQYENNRIKKTAECAATLATQCNASVERGNELSLDARIFNIRLWCVEVRLGEQLDFAANLELKTSEEETDEATIVKNEYTWHSALYGTYPEIKLSTGGDNCWIKGGQGSWELIGSDGVIKKIGKKTIFRKSFYLGYETKEKKNQDNWEEVIWNSENGIVKIKYNPEKVNVQLTNSWIIHIEPKDGGDFYNMDIAFTCYNSSAKILYQEARELIENPITGMEVLDDGRGNQTYIPYEQQTLPEYFGWQLSPSFADKCYSLDFEIRARREVGDWRKIITDYGMALNHYYITDTWNEYGLYYEFDFDEETGEIDNPGDMEEVKVFQSNWLAWVKSHPEKIDRTRTVSKHVYVVDLGRICVHGVVSPEYDEFHNMTVTDQVEFAEQAAFAEELLNEIVFE